VLRALPQRHIREVTVVSPGFAVDCLETLEELAIEGRQQFIAAGGHRYEYVPALNSSEAHARMLADVLTSQRVNWVDTARPSSADTSGLANRRLVVTA
jgi:ferrochelatase